MKNVGRIRNGGRPRKDESEKKSQTISFRVDSLTKMVIKRKALEAHLAMGEFLRRAIKSAEITPQEYEGYFREIYKFDSSKLVDFIAVSATVVVNHFTNEERKSLQDLYRFAKDVNVLVKRGNASLANAPIDVRINYLAELARLQDEFNEIKDFFIKRVVGVDPSEETEAENNKGD